MKILHTVNSLHPDTGGPARSVPGLAAAAARHGAEVHLWAGDIPDFIEEPEGVTFHRGELPEISKLELVHDHGVWLPVNHRVATWAARKGLPRMVSPRGMLEPWAINHNKWKKKLAWWLYQKRDLQSAVALHATAEAEAAQFRALGFHQPTPIVANGIDLPERPRQQLDQKTVLFLSRVHPKKGLPMWVDVWKKLRPKGWQMRVVGPDEGGHTEEIKSLVEAADLSDQWHFEGPLEGEEKLDALSSADLFALPTYSENFGIVVAEALALGTPVITTTGTPWEGLKKHRCGWWVEPEVEALTKAFSEALTSNELTEMGQRGSTWVREEFAWDAIGKKIVTAYEELLHEHRS